MRALVLIIVLLVGSPALGQQLKAITNSIGMKLVLIHPGSFTMGSPTEEVGRLDDESPHEVTISESYYLGMYEVTLCQFGKVMSEYSIHIQDSQLPVGQVNWQDAVSFCKKLSELPEEKDSGRVYRLPTEAEWEYACRATSGAAYPFGDAAESLGEYAWFGEGLGGKIHPVGEKKPNRWGLYDMLGNVSEWCQDRYADYPSEATTDPRGASGGSNRVHRGSDLLGGAAFCRSASRYSCSLSLRKRLHGFRIALTLSGKQPEAFSQELKAISNSIGMKLVLIPSGTFTMGSLCGQVQGGVSPHEVTITKSYYLGVYEVTQGQYERVMGKNPSYYSKQRLGNSDCSMYPVEMLSWEEAVVFCKNLSELREEKTAGREYRLPTEAEWEYACRATSIASFCFGDSVSSLWEYAWFGEGPTGTTHPVGGKKPNRWGLYDMHGNVAEWCQDWFGENAIDDMDPIGPDEGLLKVLRGGVYEFDDSDCPSWQRSGAKPADIEALYGFRVAMSPSVK